MSDLWREDPNSDSYNYVAQSNIGGWSRISSHPVVPVEPVDVAEAAHALAHPGFTLKVAPGPDNRECDKYWCDPFRVAAGMAQLRDDGEADDDE